ncbi:MAG: ribosome biogenesis GTPase Der [Pseudomonadota bacterium]|nr:ribosome biogenesis GTPase Der [Pseudomonadota bacterium]
MNLTATIVGRPNVGKSTLFNRLAGKKLAITHGTPGVTRDRLELVVKVNEFDVTLIDTAGFEENADQSFHPKMQHQTALAVEKANVVLFLIDSKEGVTPIDEYFSKLLRRNNVPVVLVANKCEGLAGKISYFEAFKLGFGDPIPISAEHGTGISDLIQKLAQLLDKSNNNVGTKFVQKENSKPSLAKDNSEPGIRIAIVGRPNAGKSTLINFLAGEERVITGPEAGITRDPINIPILYKGRVLQIIDTAGIRRKSRIKNGIESLTTGSAFHSIHYAQIVALVIDGNMVLEKQDLTIARKVIEEGRVLIIVVNKWDIISNKGNMLKTLESRLEKSLPQVRGVPIVLMSALTGKGVRKLIPEALSYFKLWNHRISTGELNKWLESIVERHPPPMVNGKKIRLRYITQAKTRPPTFVVFCSRGKSLPEDYRRYLTNELRSDFELPGIPIRLLIRQGDNPYETNP